MNMYLIYIIFYQNLFLLPLRSNSILFRCKYSFFAISFFLPLCSFHVKS